MKKQPLIKPGIYSGHPSNYAGLIQLEVRKNGENAVFRNIISIHLPPAEIENIEVMLNKDEQGRCYLSPSPSTIEPIIFEISNDSIVVVQKDNRTKVILERLKKLN